MIYGASCNNGSFENKENNALISVPKYMIAKKNQVQSWYTAWKWHRAFPMKIFMRAKVYVNKSRDSEICLAIEENTSLLPTYGFHPRSP